MIIDLTMREIMGLAEAVGFEINKDRLPDDDEMEQVVCIAPCHPDGLERLRKGIIAVEDLIEQSYGVAELHYNDDDAPWSDLLAGGRYEEWLLDYSAALASTKSKQEGGV